MRRAPGTDRTAPGDAGFTLIEVLAAVAIAGFVLGAIGAVFAVTLAGLRSAGDRLALIEAGRTLLGTLPRGRLVPGTTAGTIGTATWRADVTPVPRTTFASDLPSPNEQAPVWVPVAVAASARVPSGRTVAITTIGLVRRAPR